MSHNKAQQRLQALFADIEHLSTDPRADTAEMKREIESMRARLCELEEMIRNEHSAETERSSMEVLAASAPTMEPPSHVQLYEKDKVAYVFSNETLEILSTSNLTLPEAEHVVASPLTAGGEVIGEVQIVPPSNHELTPEELTLTNAIAQQASLQIQNLRLLAEAERSRIEAESATRQFIHEGWDAYLDAIQRSERIGFTYDQASVAPYTDLLHENGGIHAPVKVMDEHVGALYLQPDPNHPPTDTEKQLVDAVAAQVAQQVENIRLLADASRARAEAEEAIRSLTRGNWQGFTSERNESQLVYVYDSLQVKPTTDTRIPEKFTLSQPLVISGETIGQLAVAGLENIPSDASNVASMIAAQASIHLETLRLTEELKKRAAEMEAVAVVSTVASTLLDPDKLLQSVVDLTKERFGLYHAHIYLADEAWQTLLLAAGAGEVGRKMVEDGWNISINHESSIVATAARNRKSIIANNVHHDKDSDFLSNRLLPDTRSEMAIPIIFGEKLLGVFDVQSILVGRFTDEDANVYTTLAAQVGVALQNARLYVEQAATVTQLRELDRLKSSFLANMSHELRTPLNSILGFTDVMLEGLDGALSDYMDNDLRLIQKNGQHLLHLINDVLDMAKIESGRMNLHPENFKVHNLMEEVASITSSLASEKNISLFIDDASDRNIEVYADNTRLRQVMINLVNNSIKFTEKGSITLSTKPIEGGRVLITVKDTGIGIPPDKLESIFQEFTQVDSSTTRKAGGTGLGLPISRRLVEMHGGRLWAESSGIEGEGSTFCVELPIEARITEVIEKQEK